MLSRDSLLYLMLNYIHRFFFIALFLFISCTTKENSIPEYIIGDFQDDYDIEYKLSEEQFILKPSTRFHIISWNINEQYFIAKNDSLNNYDANLYSRIDWMKLDDMKPFEWAFCLSAYNAVSPDSARSVQIADRSKPKTGCNGYPFSRMKPITP